MATLAKSVNVQLRRHGNLGYLNDRADAFTSLVILYTQNTILQLLL